METARPQMLTVSQLNTYIKSVFDQDYRLRNILVVGEVSNFTEARSGHLYMTLKDDKSALKAVMFRGSAMRLKFRPENGMKVIAMGRITVYPRDGAYQLYCTAMALDGIGDLHAAFEQLKKKLAAYARKHPDLCRLKETAREGSATFVIDKARLSLRLTEPYSEARKLVAREKAKAQGLGGKIEN